MCNPNRAIDNLSRAKFGGATDQTLDCAASLKVTTILGLRFHMCASPHLECFDIKAGQTYQTHF